MSARIQTCFQIFQNLLPRSSRLDLRISRFKLRFNFKGGCHTIVITGGHGCSAIHGIYQTLSDRTIRYNCNPHRVGRPQRRLRNCHGVSFQRPS